MAIDAPDRVEPPIDVDERPMLEAWLDYHRDTLASKCAGLSAEQLRKRAVPPSSLSLLGLIRHMTEVERGWFGRTLTDSGAERLYFSDENPDGDFNDIDQQDPADAFRLWREACAESRRLSEGVPLDQIAAARRRPDDFRPNLRWIMIHMIEEYARHNGHADFLRERIDGQTGD